MPAEVPTPIPGAKTAWMDLLAINAARPWLTAIAAAICCGASLVDNAAFSPVRAISPSAILLGFVLALLETFFDADPNFGSSLCDRRRRDCERA